MKETNNASKYRAKLDLFHVRPEKIIVGKHVYCEFANFRLKLSFFHEKRTIL